MNESVREEEISFLRWAISLLRSEVADYDSMIKVLKQQSENKTSTVKRLTERLNHLEKGN